TEACSQIATFGWPLPGVDVRLAGDGEVLVRGAIVSLGALAGDGWLHSGDLGALDERGRLVIAGRKADTIVSGGENVAPAEVEAPESPNQLTIEQLAAQSGMSVRNIRAHQARGLLDPPEVRARVGYYGPEHLEQLRLIRDLQEDGFNLGAIKRLLDDTQGTAA